MEKRALIIELNKQNEGTIEALISFIEVLASRGDNNIEMSYYYGGCVYQRQGLGVMRERGKLFRGKFLDDKLEESSNSSLSTPSQSPFLLPSFFFPPLFSNQNSPASEKLEKLKASKTEKQSKLSNNLLSKKSSTLQLKRKSDNEEQVIGNKTGKSEEVMTTIANLTLNPMEEEKEEENPFFLSNSNLVYKRGEEESEMSMMLPKESSWVTLKPSYGRQHVLSSVPDDLFLCIFKLLDLKSLLTVSQVCTEWKRLTNDKRIWKAFFSNHFKRALTFTPNTLHHNTYNTHSYNKLKGEGCGWREREGERESGGGGGGGVLVKEAVDWKERVKKKYILDRNWKMGEFVSKNLRGHTELVTGLDFESNKLVSSSYDGTVRLWNIQTGNTLQVLSNSHTSPSPLPPPLPLLSLSPSLPPPPPVWCCKFGVGEKVMTGSGDSKIRVWDLATMKCIAQYRKHLGGIKCLQLDESKIITGSDDKTVKIFDIKSGQCVRTIQQGGAVSSLCFHGDLLFTATKMSPKIQCHEIRGGNLLHEFTEGHKKAVYSLSYDPFAKTLASGGRDKSIILWDCTDIPSNSVRRKLSGHRYSIMSLQIDQDKVVSGSADNTIRIWDIESGVCRQILHQGHNQMITALKFDEEKIVSGSADRTLIVADFSAKTKSETKFTFFS